VQFGHLPLDKDGQEDLYTLVVTVYRNDGMFNLCSVHGGTRIPLAAWFFSAARTLGSITRATLTGFEIAGWAYSIGICAGFALIPLYVHFANYDYVERQKYPTDPRAEVDPLSFDH